MCYKNTYIPVPKTTYVNRVSNCEDAPWVTKHTRKYYSSISGVNREEEGIMESVKGTRPGIRWI